VEGPRYLRGAAEALELSGLPVDRATVEGAAEYVDGRSSLDE